MIIGFGLIVVAFLLMAPPWMYEVQTSDLKLRRPGPQAFILNPPVVPVTTSDAYGATYFEGESRSAWSVRVDAVRLSLELFAVAALTVVLCIARMEPTRQSLQGERQVGTSDGP